MRDCLPEREGKGKPVPSAYFSDINRDDGHPEDAHLPPGGEGRAYPGVRSIKAGRGAMTVPAEALDLFRDGGVEPADVSKVFHFPASRAVLWDRTSCGDAVTLNPLDCAPVVSFTDEAVHQVAQLLQHDAALRAGGGGNFHLEGHCFNPDDSRPLQITLKGLQRGQPQEHGFGGVSDARNCWAPAALTPAPAGTPAKIGGGGGDDLDLVDRFRTGCTQRHLNGPWPLAPMAFWFARGEGAGHVEVEGRLLLPAAAVRLTPVHMLQVCETALSISLRRAQLQGAHHQRTGYMTMNQTRKVLLLLDNEPRAFELPLVGVWVSGVEGVYHPLVWGACIRFLNNPEIKERALQPPAAFLLAVHRRGTARPSFYEVQVLQGEGGTPVVRYHFVHRMVARGGGGSAVAARCQFYPVAGAPAATLKLSYGPAAGGRSREDDAALLVGGGTCAAEDPPSPRPYAPPLPHTPTPPRAGARGRGAGGEASKPSQLSQLSPPRREWDDAEEPAPALVAAVAAAAAIHHAPSAGESVGASLRWPFLSAYPPQLGQPMAEQQHLSALAAHPAYAHYPFPQPLADYRVPANAAALRLGGGAVAAHPHAPGAHDALILQQHQMLQELQAQVRALQVQVQAASGPLGLDHPPPEPAAPAPPPEAPGGQEMGTNTSFLFAGPTSLEDASRRLGLESALLPKAPAAAPSPLPASADSSFRLPSAGQMFSAGGHFQPPPAPAPAPPGVAEGADPASEGVVERGCEEGEDSGVQGSGEPRSDVGLAEGEHVAAADGVEGGGVEMEVEVAEGEVEVQVEEEAKEEGEGEGDGPGELPEVLAEAPAPPAPSAAGGAEAWSGPELWEPHDAPPSASNLLRSSVESGCSMDLLRPALHRAAASSSSASSDGGDMDMLLDECPPPGGAGGLAAGAAAPAGGEAGGDMPRIVYTPLSDDEGEEGEDGGGLDDDVLFAKYLGAGRGAAAARGGYQGSEAEGGDASMVLDMSFETRAYLQSHGLLRPKGGGGGAHPADVSYVSEAGGRAGGGGGSGGSVLGSVKLQGLPRL